MKPWYKDRQIYLDWRIECARIGVPKELICSTSINLQMFLSLLKEQFINKTISTVQYTKVTDWAEMLWAAVHNKISLLLAGKGQGGHAMDQDTSLCHWLVWQMQQEAETKGSSNLLQYRVVFPGSRDLWLAGISYKLLDKPCQMRLFSSFCHAGLSKWVLSIGGKHILSSVLFYNRVLFRFTTIPEGKCLLVRIIWMEC